MVVLVIEWRRRWTRPFWRGCLTIGSLSDILVSSDDADLQPYDRGPPRRDPLESLEHALYFNSVLSSIQFASRVYFPSRDHAPTPVSTEFDLLLDNLTTWVILTKDSQAYQLEPDTSRLLAKSTTLLTLTNTHPSSPTASFLSCPRSWAYIGEFSIREPPTSSHRSAMATQHQLTFEAITGLRRATGRDSFCKL